MNKHMQSLMSIKAPFFLPHLFLIGTMLIMVMASCDSNKSKTSQKKNVDEDTVQTVNIDWEQIKERGKLKAITSYSSTSYFIYRGQPMGYEYELLERLADHLDVELEIVVADNLNDVFEMLKKGEGDLIAHMLTITKQRKKRVDFTEPHTQAKQVLVQRKPENWRRMMRHKIEEQLIRNQINLIGKTVHVRKNASYYERLQHLEKEIGGDITIEAVPGTLETELLIQQVADGEIDYTVADKNIAMLNKTYNPILDVQTPISFPQRLAWVVRKNSPELREKVNDWIRGMKKTSDYYVIYNKYFKNKKAFASRAKSEYFSRKGNRISQYDELVKQYAEMIGWDWRLLSAQIYQESGFKPKAHSWAGAKGLMQLMAGTAKDFGAKDPSKPQQSLKAGTNYIEFLKKRWHIIPDSAQRLKFVLASYNVGQGHVADARRLAEKYGKDPNVWDDNVEEFILKKSESKYYNDEVVKFGYCRGKEPYQYVKKILKRYSQYTKFIEMTAAIHQSEYKKVAAKR